MAASASRALASGAAASRALASRALASRALASMAAASRARAVASPAPLLSKVESTGFRSYSSYVKTKSGIYVPAPPSVSERLMKFIKKHWNDMDERLKEVVVKGIMLTVSGGGTVIVLTRTLLERMDKLEARVNESLNGVKTSVSDLKLQVAKSDIERDAKYDKLQAQVNGLSDLLRNVSKDEKA